MALVVESVLKRGLALRSDVSQAFLEVDAKYLSKHYNIGLYVEAWVEGEIIAIERVHGSLSEEEKRAIEEHAVGKRVRLYVDPGFFTGIDKLYFDESSWTILRDLGIFPNEYKLRVKLDKLILKDPITGRGDELVLYPYRDVIAR